MLAESEFMNITAVTAELIQGSLSADDWSQNQLYKLQHRNALASRKHESLKRQRERLQESMSQTKALVDYWMVRYKQDYENLPDSWYLVGEKLKEGLANFAAAFKSKKDDSYELPKPEKKKYGSSCSVEEKSNFNLCIIGNDGSSTGFGQKSFHRYFYVEERTALVVFEGLTSALKTFTEEMKSKLDENDLRNDIDQIEMFMMIVNNMHANFRNPSIQKDIRRPIDNFFVQIKIYLQSIR